MPAKCLICFTIEMGLTSFLSLSRTEIDFPN